MQWDDLLALRQISTQAGVNFQKEAKRTCVLLQYSLPIVWSVVVNVTLGAEILWIDWTASWIRESNKCVLNLLRIKTPACIISRNDLFWKLRIIITSEIIFLHLYVKINRIHKLILGLKHRFEQTTFWPRKSNSKARIRSQLRPQK